MNICEKDTDIGIWPVTCQMNLIFLIAEKEYVKAGVLVITGHRGNRFYECLHSKCTTKHDPKRSLSLKMIMKILQS